MGSIDFANASRVLFEKGYVTQSNRNETLRRLIESNRYIHFEKLASRQSQTFPTFERPKDTSVWEFDFNSKIRLLFSSLSCIHPGGARMVLHMDLCDMCACTCVYVCFKRTLHVMAWRLLRRERADQQKLYKPRRIRLVARA